MPAERQEPAASYDEVVTTRQGRAGGLRAGQGHEGQPRASQVTVFAGIPYAAAARFAAPGTVDAWGGVLDARRPGPAAPQLPSRLAAVMGPAPALTSEADCLTLNVWTPDPGGSFPVLFWLHGGAWTSGSGGWPWYDGARLAAEQQLVVVTANYRLGPLGYLFLAGLDETLGRGNFGLADQAAALAWVAEQIPAFGGDPARITVGGQSAGAHSAALLTSAGPARGLARRVLLQSGPLWPLPAEDAAAQTAAAVVGELGLDPSAAATAETLRTLPPGELLAAAGRLAQRARTLGNVSPPLQPCAGTGLHPAGPLAALAAAPDDLDVMAGATTEEMRAFFDQDPAVRAVDRVAAVAVLDRGLADGAGVYAAYAGREPGRSPGELLSQILTDRNFTAGAVNAALAREPHRGQAFVYQFDWRSGPFGACHCVELPFLLGEEAAWAGSPMLAGIGDEYEPLRRAFSGAVGSFVRDGSPGWAPFSRADPVAARFGPGPELSAGPRPDLAELTNLLAPSGSAAPGR